MGRSLALRQRSPRCAVPCRAVLRRAAASRRVAGAPAAPRGPATRRGGVPRSSQPRRPAAAAARRPLPAPQPYQGYSGDYDSVSALAPYWPQFSASDILKGTPGGLYVRCRPVAGGDCDARAGDYNAPMLVSSGNISAVQV